MPDPSGPRAGFWQRFGAVVVDGVLLNVVGTAIRFAAGATVGAIVGIVLGLVYFSYLEGSGSGQTLGKKLVGIRVYDFRQGGPIGFGRALVRYVGRIASTLPCLLGYLWMLWDKEKQTWHDKIASTVVVPVADYPVDRWPG